MKVWVYSRLEYISKRFELEIWFKEPTSQKDVYFEWPPDVNEVKANTLIKRIFERKETFQDFKLQFVGH
jgi:hypothetical protein